MKYNDLQALLEACKNDPQPICNSATQTYYRAVQLGFLGPMSAWSHAIEDLRVPCEHPDFVEESLVADSDVMCHDATMLRPKQEPNT